MIQLTLYENLYEAAILKSSKVGLSHFLSRQMAYTSILYKKMHL